MVGFTGWATVSFNAAWPFLAKERGAVLKKWHQLMLDHQEALAVLMTAECGKPLAEARGEVTACSLPPLLSPPYVCH